jgi:hypothetical protein
VMEKRFTPFGGGLGINANIKCFHQRGRSSKFRGFQQ